MKLIKKGREYIKVLQIVDDNNRVINFVNPEDRFNGTEILSLYDFSKKHGLVERQMSALGRVNLIDFEGELEF